MILFTTTLQVLEFADIFHTKGFSAFIDTLSYYIALCKIISKEIKFKYLPRVFVAISAIFWKESRNAAKANMVALKQRKLTI